MNVEGIKEAIKRDVSRVSQDCSDIRGAAIVGFTLDRRARVWLKMSDSSETRGKRFMSRRIAKRWGRRQVGKAFFSFEFTPVRPISYIKINATLERP